MIQQIFKNGRFDAHTIEAVAEKDWFYFTWCIPNTTLSYDPLFNHDRQVITYEA
jgi:hypothetical protein